MNTRGRAGLSFLMAWSLVLVWAAVAAAGSGVVAEVGGEPILRSQVEERIRELHRNRPRMKAEGEAVAVDVATIVQAMVDERLMVQEAERLGLDSSDSVRRGLDAYTRDQAVLRLRRIEVLDQVRVSDEEAEAAFANQGGGQVSDQERERALERIRKAMLRRRVQERSEAYVQELAKRFSLAVDQARLAALEPGREVSDGDAEVARVGEARILAREVQAELDRIAGSRQGMIRASHSDEAYESWLGRARDAALRNLTTPLLVEAEAHRRGLEKDPEVAELAEVRRRELLVQALLVEIIAPLAEPGEAEMRAYLAAHPGEFARDSEYRFASIRFVDPAAAEAMLAEIRQGAAFEYLAGTLGDRGQEDRTRVWVPGGELAPAVRRELESLQPGGVGGVVADGRGYVLLKLNGRRGGEALPFAEAREALRLAVGRRNFERVRAEYLERLRAAAGITIHQDALAGMEADLWRPLPESAQSPAGEP